MKIITEIFLPLINHPLNKRNRINAVFNFFKWQFRLRFANPNELIVPFTKKSQFYVKKGRTGLTGNLYCGLHEFEDMMFLLHFLRPEDSFFDIGSNVGSYSILANSHVGAKTTSFEPLPSTVELLSRNKDVNGNSTSWKIEMLALGDKEDFLWFTSDRDTMNQIVDSEYVGPKIKVSVITLDGYCNSKQTLPNLIKIDAEGFDENVVRGGQNSLSNDHVKALIIESDTKVVKEILLEGGFEPFVYEPFSRRLTKGYNTGSNQIYIKDLEFVKQRIDSAEKVKIKGYSI
jgi:FkbM family methyltransferase